VTVKLKPVDAVIVGMGWAGSIMAHELTRAGLNVIGLERGPVRRPSQDFTLPGIRDELRYAVRQELFADTSTETLTFRHGAGETALPIRRWGAFTPGTGLGGAGSHWNGMHWRYLPYDLNPRRHIQQRYGRGALAPEMTIGDFGIEWDEIEPYYERFEKLCGVSGKAGNIGGQIIAGGNPFEGARGGEFPNAPLERTAAGDLFAGAAQSLGYKPFPLPASNASAAYTNPEGARLGACTYCGHCERFGCETNAKASPNTTLVPALLSEPRFTLRSGAWVSQILYDRHARKARGVLYTDTASGETYEQPADLVIVAGYVFTNTKLLLTSGIGRPIGYHPVPPGTPRWGGAWKQAAHDWYGRTLNIGASGASYAHRGNYLDLDPTYRDALGQPLLRMTYNFRENDRKLAAYATEVTKKIAVAMPGVAAIAPANPRGDFHVVPYQSTHNTGGTIMGADPHTSAVNRYLQSWEADNLFVLGASVFPQNTSYNPTGTVGALA
jgi:choline dehydrogenase-like flavoprotein